jgi:purine/pyrimidine-nucleoside phosphorylase
MRAAMSQAEYPNVTVVAKANVYFDGKVVSHTIKLGDGAKKTLGLIYEGEFHFGTDAPERMDITAGSCEVRLDGETSWKTYEGGSFFKVPGKSGFDIKVASGIAEYVCSYE